MINSVAPDRPDPAPKLSSSNLGMPLIMAFSNQLRTRSSSAHDKTGQTFRLWVSFTASAIPVQIWATR